MPEIYRERGVRFGRDLPADHRLGTFPRSGSVYTDATGTTYASRLRRLAHNARTGIEETGGNNLYLTMGSLHWSIDGRELESPLTLITVVLIPVMLSPRGRGESATYRIKIDEAGASTPNFCLLEKLKQTHGLTIPELSEPAQDQHGIDLEGALRAVRIALAKAGLPFRVEESAHVSMLQFAKLRPWKDLAEQ